MSRQSDVSWYLAADRTVLDGVPVVRLSGRMGSESSQPLDRALAEAASMSRAGLALDLSGVDYLSSAGLNVIESAAARLGADGRVLILFNLTDPLKIALHFVGSLPHVVIEDSEASARARGK